MLLPKSLQLIAQIRSLAAPMDKTRREIAEELGISYDTVKSLCNRHKIETKMDKKSHQIHGPGNKQQAEWPPGVHFEDSEDIPQSPICRLNVPSIFESVRFGHSQYIPPERF